MMSRACEFSISRRIMPAARRRDRSGDDAGRDDVGRARRRAARDRPDRSIISLKRWFITASRPSARNMHSPCGMLFNAVSNWPASAASRSRATSARTKIFCRLVEMCLSAKKNSTFRQRHADVIGTAVQRPAPPSADRRPAASANGRSTAGRRCGRRRPRCSRCVTRGHDHVGDGVVGAQQRDQAPDARAQPHRASRRSGSAFPSRAASSDVRSIARLVCAACRRRAPRRSR